MGGTFLEMWVRKRCENLAVSAAPGKSSGQVYWLIFMCVRKLSKSVQRQADLYDYWHGGK